MIILITAVVVVTVRVVDKLFLEMLVHDEWIGCYACGETWL